MKDNTHLLLAIAMSVLVIHILLNIGSAGTNHLRLPPRLIATPFSPFSAFAEKGEDSQGAPKV
jgi:hypothetical protein